MVVLFTGGDNDTFPCGMHRKQKIAAPIYGGGGGGGVTAWIELLQRGVYIDQTTRPAYESNSFHTPFRPNNTGKAAPTTICLMRR